MCGKTGKQKFLVTNSKLLTVRSQFSRFQNETCHLNSFSNNFQMLPYLCGWSLQWFRQQVWVCVTSGVSVFACFFMLVFEKEAESLFSNFFCVSTEFIHVKILKSFFHRTAAATRPLPETLHSNVLTQRLAKKPTGKRTEFVCELSWKHEYQHFPPSWQRTQSQPHNGRVRLCLSSFSSSLKSLVFMHLRCYRFLMTLTSQNLFSLKSKASAVVKDEQWGSSPPRLVSLSSSEALFGLSPLTDRSQSAKHEKILPAQPSSQHRSRLTSGCQNSRPTPPPTTDTWSRPVKTPLGDPSVHN